MDIFEIQSLIEKNRVITPANIDLANMYVQVGVYQPDNRKIGAGNANTFKSYVCPASLLGGGGPPPTPPVDKKNFVLVDPYGNDGTAQKYNMFLPYQSINKAILAAVPGDVIIVNPGTYFVTQNMFIPGVDFYIWEGATVYVFVNPIATAGTDDINILGNGTINLYAYSLLAGNYSGNLNIECDYFNAYANQYYGDTFSGNVNIKVNNKLTIGYGGSTNYYWDNPGYYGTATKPNQMTMTLNEVEVFGNIFLLYRDSVQININIKKYTYNGPGGNFAKDFFKVGNAFVTYPVVNHIHIDDFVCNKNLFFGSPVGYSDSCFWFFLGSSQSTTYITGNYVYKGNGAAIQLPALFQYSSCPENLFIDANITVIKGAVFTDLNATGNVEIAGNVFVDNGGVAFTEYLFAAYFISGVKARIMANTRMISAFNPIVQIGAYTAALTPEVDVVDCQLVNNGNTLGFVFTIIAKGFDGCPSCGGTPPYPNPLDYGILRVVNTRIINGGPSSIEGGAVGDLAELVTVYSNRTTLNITNSVPAMPGLFVDAALTGAGF